MILFALALAGVPPASNRAIQSYLYAELDSCAAWTADRSKDSHKEREQEGWILGFVTGLNAFGPNNGNIAPDTNTAGLLGWVDNYCKANPLDSVTIAAFALTKELKRRSER